MASKTKAPALTRLVTRLARGRLCYAKPIDAHGRTIVPVTRVSLAGGFGSGDAGGGNLQARPVGYIEIGPEGTRFERIEQPSAARLVSGAVVAAGAAGALAVARKRSARLRIQAGPARKLLGR